MLGHRARQIQCGADPLFENAPGLESLPRWDGIDPVVAGMKEFELNLFNMKVECVNRCSS